MRSPILQYSKNQPNNVDAWKLGRAVSESKRGGDPIDHGLSLVQHLEAEGFGVIHLSAGAGVAPQARPLDEWHENHGPVVWFTWRDGQWLGEPSWCGTPNDSDWPGYHTHFTPHPLFPKDPT